MNVTILCVSDREYLPILEPLIISLERNSGLKFELRVRLINCEQVPVWLSGYDVIQDDTELSTKRDKMIADGYLLNEGVMVQRKSRIKTARWLYSDLMAYCVNKKFDDICDLLDDKDNEIIIYLDADTIVRKHLTTLLHMLQDVDILIRSTTGNADKKITEPHGVLYHIGMMLINNNKKSRMFYRTLNERIKEGNFYDWDADQIQFSNCVKMYENEITIQNIPETYKDEKMDDMSHVWCGASTGKISNDKYLKEMNEYRYKSR